MKAFLIFTVTRNPSVFKAFLSSKISDISFSLSRINLFLRCAVWLDEIKVAQTFFNLMAKAIKISLVSIFRKDVFP